VGVKLLKIRPSQCDLKKNRKTARKEAATRKDKKKSGGSGAETRVAKMKHCDRQVTKAGGSRVLRERRAARSSYAVGQKKLNRKRKPELTENKA